MKHSDDVVNLFQQFGAKADPYYELARKQEHKLSNERWPLVSAVRNAVADDVPSVDRSASAAVSSKPLQGPVSAPARPEPAVAPARVAPVQPEMPRPAQAAAAATAPAVPVASASAPSAAFAVPATPVATPAAGREPPAALRASPSPLASLAGLRSQSAPPAADALAVPAESFPADLPSVFARLAGTPAPGSAAPAPVWQPRKGHP